MRIRKASLEDITHITQLFYDTVTVVNTKDYNPVQISVWAEAYSNRVAWENRIKAQHFFVMETVDKKIVGFISMAHDGYIDVLFVHKDHQGQGIATLLLGHIEQLARAMSIQKLWSDVSITARPFFEKSGYEVIKVYVKVLSGVEFANSIMSKGLE